MSHFQKEKDDYKISKNEFDEIKNQALLIDVREPEEYQMLKKMPNSINVPYRTLIANPEKYIKDKKTIVVTICNAGNRSGVAAKALREQGYTNAYTLSDGVYGYFK